MQPVPPEIWATFERRLDEMRVPAPQRPDYRKWVRFYLDFCHKYGHPAASPASREPFLAKLASKNQSVVQRGQASAAVGLLLQSAPEPGAARPSPTAASARHPRPPLPGSGEIETRGDAQAPLAPPQPPSTAQRVRPPPAERGLPEPPRPRPQDRPAAALPGAALPGAQAAPPPAPGRGASWQQEYRDLEAAVLLRNYSTRILEAYRFWVVKFQSFVRSRPTAGLGVQEVRGFLSDLAVRHRVAASTQNQAFNALLFFYRHVLRREFGQLDGVVRAKRHRYVPVVLSHTETEAIKKYKNAAKEFIWQWFFPAPTLTFIPKLQEQRRYHLHEAHVQGAVKQAATRAAIPKRVSPHIFRHTFASHLLLADYDLQTIQKLLGHSDIKTTMIYLQTVPGVTLKEAKSPLDLDPSLATGRSRPSV